MKIIKTNSKSESPWSSKMVEASIPKYSSLSVSAGSVYCPMTNGNASTINCEICQHCQGVDFNTENNSETIRCAHKESANIKTANKDEVDRLYVSEKPVEDKTVTPEDLKSIFARSTSKYCDLSEKDQMNAHSVISAKNINESDSDGTANFVPKYSNSIFDSEAIGKLVEEQKLVDEKKIQSKAESKLKQKESSKEWERDTKEILMATGYEPKGMTKSTSSETESNNPDVSEYKFSIFENIDDKLKNMTELTDGEKLKSQSKTRKENISRAKTKDDWESNHSKNTTTSGIVKDFFDKAFSKE
jgi:hypothetical protein